MSYDHFLYRRLPPKPKRWTSRRLGTRRRPGNSKDQQSCLKSPIDSSDSSEIHLKFIWNVLKSSKIYRFIKMWKPPFFSPFFRKRLPKSPRPHLSRCRPRCPFSPFVALPPGKPKGIPWHRQCREMGKYE